MCTDRRGKYGTKSRNGKQGEKREDIEAQGGISRNHAAVSKPPPPAPPIRGSRPETQGRIDEEKKRQRRKQQEESATISYKGCGQDIKGCPAGKEKDSTYTNERVSTPRKVYVPCGGNRENRGKAYRPKFDSERDSGDRYIQHKERYRNKVEREDVCDWEEEYER